MSYTADQLITDARNYATLPTYDEGADARLLRLLNTEQWTYLTQQLERTREEYRTATLSVSVVSGQLTYALPTRAVAAGLKMIQAVDTAGNRWGMWELRPQDWATNGIWTSPCRRFYIYGNFINFYSDPPAGTLLLTYPLRLSELVLSTDTANVRTISTINTGTKTLTLSGTFTNASGICDLVRATPHFDILGMDSAFTGSGTSTLVFTNTLPTGLAVGDYVCTPGKSPVCQAPLELHSLLAQHVAWVTLMAKGDPKAAAAQMLRDDTAKRVLTLLQPRPQRQRSIINYNAPGWVGPWGGWWPYRGGGI